MNRADCQRRADELEEVAAQLPDSVQRDDYLMLARHWRDLAAADLEPAEGRDV
jgi:hypothetical protein